MEPCSGTTSCACRAALVELVALKALHDRIEATDFVTESDYICAEIDYFKRKDAAWAAAREAVKC